MFAHERAQSSSLPRQNRFPDAFIQSFCSFPIRNKISEEWVSARFSPHPGQEHIFALGAEGGTIALCSAEDLCKKRDFVKRRLTSSSRSVVFDFAFLPKLENKLLSLSGNWRLNLWDFEVGTSVHLIGHANSVRCASVCPENPYVVFSGSRDGSIFGWDLRTAPKTNFVGPQTDPIMAIYPQRTYINAHETTVDEHFPSSPRIPQSVTAKPQRNPPSITGLLHLGSNHLISASSSVSSGIRIWDLRYQTTSGPLQKLSVPQTMAKQSGITSLSWDRFKSSFFASCTDNTVHEYMPAVNTNQPVRTLRGESINSFYVQCSASPFSDHLLCGTSSKRAIIWDLQENRNYGNGGQAKISAPNYLPKPKFALGEHDAEVECVQWSHQGKYILTLSWDCLRLWSHWANKNENDEFQEEYYFEDRPFKMAFPTLLPNASVEGDEEIKKAFSTQRSEQLLTRSPLQMIDNLPAHYLDFQLGDANQWHKLQFRTPRKIIIKENASFTPACKIPRVEGHENLSASKESMSSRRNLSANFRHRQQTTPTGSGAKKRRQTPSSNKANLKGIKSSTKSPFKSPTGDSNSSSSILRYFSPS